MQPSEKAGILVVDDQAPIRHIVRTIISANGWPVVGEAGNGENALLMVDKHKPWLVCLDLDLPDIHGIEVLKQIKQIYPGTAVIIVSGSDDSEQVMRAIKAGADGYIVKPFSSAKVAKIIQAVREKYAEKPPSSNDSGS